MYEPAFHTPETLFAKTFFRQSWDLWFLNWLLSSFLMYRKELMQILGAKVHLSFKMQSQNSLKINLLCTTFCSEGTGKENLSGGVSEMEQIKQGQV